MRNTATTKSQSLPFAEPRSINRSWLCCDQLHCRSWGDWRWSDRGTPLAQAACLALVFVGVTPITSLSPAFASRACSLPIGSPANMMLYDGKVNLQFLRLFIRQTETVSRLISPIAEPSSRNGCWLHCIWLGSCRNRTGLRCGC